MNSLADGRSNFKKFKVVDAAMEVHKELGPGFLEAVYRETLEIKLKLAIFLLFLDLRFPPLFKGKSIMGRIFCVTMIFWWKSKL